MTLKNQTWLHLLRLLHTLCNTSCRPRSPLDTASVPCQIKVKILATTSDSSWLNGHAIRKQDSTYPQTCPKMQYLGAKDAPIQPGASFSTDFFQADDWLLECLESALLRFAWFNLDCKRAQKYIGEQTKTCWDLLKSSMDWCSSDELMVEHGVRWKQIA